MCPRTPTHSVGETWIASLERAAMNARIAHSHRQPAHPRDHSGPGVAVSRGTAARCAAMICVLALAGATTAPNAHASVSEDRSDDNAQSCPGVVARTSCPQSREPMLPGGPTSPFDLLVRVGVLRIPALGPLEDALQTRCASPAAAQESGDCPPMPQSPGIGGGHPAMTMI
jgi:hypothetical protein